ncbi:MAG: hypothetical protein ACT452_18395 [Microthrixaceae bacterium]
MKRVWPNVGMSRSPSAVLGDVYSAAALRSLRKSATAGSEDGAPDLPTLARADPRLSPRASDPFQDGKLHYCELRRRLGDRQCPRERHGRRRRLSLQRCGQPRLHEGYDVRFSEAFDIQRKRKDDWFDPHLSVDTKLFIDPLLLFLADKAPWDGAHDELITHFAKCFELIGKGGSPNSVSAGVALRLLTFPEPSEFCLGYTATGTSGSGSGARYAKTIVDGIAVALAAGLDHPEHIEEIGILNEGIGADRISDATCNVLKHRFITYTRGVAHRHQVPVDAHRVRHARCYPDLGRWKDEVVELPTNPTNGKPILLVPQLLLDDLPVLNADDWFVSPLNEDLRRQLNLSVGQRVRKKDIVKFARRTPDRVRQWAREQTSRPDLAGYDFQQDRKGVVQWDGKPAEFAEANPITDLTAVEDLNALRALVRLMLDKYRHFIEHQGGWSLLWNDDTSEKPEEAAQLLFLGMAQHYLRMFDVELDREVELGRGPVDFKLSRGPRLRLVIELKKAHNGKFWNGLDTQLPTYMQSDDCNEGWFVAMRYRSTKASQQRMNELPGRVREAAGREGKTISHASIDARKPLSASRA